MKYDFDSVTDRKGTYSLKWDVNEGELPMWVADMDFKTAPEITEAILERAAHGIYGYTIVPDEWAEAYSEWWRVRHGFRPEKDALIFVNGVVPAISSIVRKITTPAEKVLLQTPVYNIFFNSVLNNGRNVTEAPLIYHDRAYSIDFDMLGEKLSDPQTSLMILCNPHNPIGKIWDRETLARIGRLCAENNVKIISDEIHCDLTDPGREYVPFASVSDECAQNSITCMAPTKAFNIAGLQTAAVYVPDKAMRHKVRRALNTDEIAEPNAFAVQAAIAAFTKGGRWLDELREYISKNKEYVYEYIGKNIPGVKAVRSEATYLMWLDFSDITDDACALAHEIRKKTGLYISEGSQYGRAGAAFMRMNIACPAKILQDGLDRLREALALI